MLVKLSFISKIFFFDKANLKYFFGTLQKLYISLKSFVGELIKSLAGRYFMAGTIITVSALHDVCAGAKS